MNSIKNKAFKIFNYSFFKLIKSILKKYQYLFYIILFTPIFFLNIRNDHDWGGDFAQYIEQAKLFSQFKSMTNIGYIYNESFPSLSPKVYPPFFSILLSPFYFLFQLNIAPYNYLISFFLVALGVLSIHFLKNHFGVFRAVLISILFIYNPFFIVFKSEILADIPFSTLYLILIILFSSKNDVFKNWLILGLLIGISCTIKSIGLSIFIALILHSSQIAIFDYIKHKNFQNTLRKIAPIYKSIITGFSVITVINFVAFHEIKVSSGYEKTLINIENLYLTFGENVFYYSELIKGFFNNYGGTELWLTNLLGTGILIFFLSGLLNSIKKESSVLNWLTIVYFITLFFYPYKNSGFRFLIPIIPLVLFYVSKSINLLFKTKNSLIVFYTVILITIFQYKKQIIQIQLSNKIIQEGPYLKSVKFAFKEVNKMTSNKDIIVFQKPSVLSLYANRKSFCNSQNSSIDELTKEFSRLHPTHFLIYEKLNNTSLVNYIKEKKLKIIWRSKDFKLYKS